MIDKTLARWQGEEYHGLTALHLAIAYGNDELAEVSEITKPFKRSANLVKTFSQVLVQAGAPINQKADGTFFHPKYLKERAILLS